MLTLTILKKIIAKLNLLYSISFIQGNVTWWHRVLLWFLHDRAAFSQMPFQSSSTCNIILLYILLMYSHSFLVYFMLSVLTNQFQVLWHKTLLQKHSPYPDSSKLPAISGLLQHSKTLQPSSLGKVHKINSDIRQTSRVPNYGRSKRSNIHTVSPVVGRSQKEWSTKLRFFYLLPWKLKKTQTNNFWGFLYFLQAQHLCQADHEE